MTVVSVRPRRLVDIVDLYAGPGGWSEALRMHGLKEVGIDWDQSACDIATAAGHERICGDVRDYLRSFKDVKGIIASPPCPSFSMAGKGSGRKEMAQVLEGVEIVARGGEIPTFDDERTGMVLEPMRWVRYHHPLWVAFEQVPTVQPCWDLYADVLRDWGYNVWTQRVHFERLGVPQTRKRSILLGHRIRTNLTPIFTHSRYHSRNPEKLDPGVLKWVSMAEALGWGAELRPFVSVCSEGGPRGGTGVYGGSGSVRAIERERDEGSWMVSNYGSGGDPAARGVRFGSEPAFAVTSKIGRNLVFAGAGATAETTAQQVPRELDQPAHTITGKGTAAWRQRRPRELVVSTGNNSAIVAPDLRRPIGKGAWRAESQPFERSIDVPAPTLDTKVGTAWRVHPAGGRGVVQRGALATGTRAKAPVRSVDYPAPTLAFGHDSNSHVWVPNGTRPEDIPELKADDDWIYGRPATTIAADSRVAKPGHRCMVTDCCEGRVPESRQSGSIRVTVQEAGILQSFRADYPWHAGRNKTKQYEAVGNAISVLAAYAVLKPLL